jgi:thiamine kinase
MNPVLVGATALRVEPDAVIDVEPIKHGLTNESWLVRTRTEAVIVRSSNPATNELRIDRASESVVLDVVAAAAIGAPVLLNDPQRYLLVTRYVGEPWSLYDACVEANIERLAARLSDLHRLPLPIGVRSVNLDETVRGYLGTLDAHGVDSGFGRQQSRDRALLATEQLQALNTPCLCHNDVHHLNVVGVQGLLIDWEYAGIGDPAFDLASVCVYHRYAAALRDLLLDEYAARGQAIGPERLALASWVFEYVRDLWMAVRDLTPM